MLLLLCSLVFPPLILVLLLKIRASTRNGVLPPGPPRFPIIGNLHQLSNSTLHCTLQQLSRRYGPLVYLQLGGVPAVVVSSAEMAKEILKILDLESSGRPFHANVYKVTYKKSDMVFSSYGEYWRERRKICIIALFCTKSVQSFRFIREDEISILLKSISKFASASNPVNLSEMIFSTANNIICRIAFGKSFPHESSEGSAFYEMLDERHALAGRFAFANYFPSVGWMLDALTGLNAKLERDFQRFDSFHKQIIEDHLDPKRTKPEKEDIVDTLLRMQKDKTSTIDFTLDTIKAILMDILIAGADTTTSTLVWAMTLLAKNPTVMKKAQNEVRSLIGNKGKITEDDLHQFHYLKCVIKETLRLQPPAPLLVPRETMQHCTIDGYNISSKTVVMVNAWAIGRDPQYWENPEEFIPERFTKSSIDFRGQHFEFIPFGSGRRICPGMQLGVVIVELILANLLYSFNWELPEGIKEEDIDMEALFAIIMHKKNNLHLVATKCNDHH
uniref:Cytochrome P450 71A1-like n=1 Tax=Nelumbo nucifera TaxID=4432 RepID=A0A822YZS3_NELNU|nr:TPA_asm: hypothetical protein HUJ06_013917 [Nelumbo nucifera]